MTTYKIGKASVAGDKVELPIFDIADDSMSVELIQTTLQDFALVLIELSTSFDIQPAALDEVLDGSYWDRIEKPTDIYGGSITYDTDREEYVVALHNGDTGAKEFGYGTTVVRAWADLLRSHGFKHRLPTVTSRQWTTDFKYGFNRISEEILQQEMDLIYAPEKGAW